MKNILILFSFYSLNLVAQYDDLGNYHDINNLTVLNPAFAGKEKAISFNLNRNSSQLLHINLTKQKNGFSFYQINTDNHILKRNTHTDNYTSVQYSRLINLNQKTNLNIGVGLKQHMYPTYTKTEVLSNRAISSSLGFLIIRNSFYLGVSGLNLELTNKDYSRVKLLKLQTGIHLYLNETTSITPSILVNYEEYFGPDLYLGLNIRKKGVAINLGYQSESSRLFLGNEYENDRIRISYTYSHEIYSIATVSNMITKHSILFTYKLINKKE